MFLQSERVENYDKDGNKIEPKKIILKYKKYLMKEINFIYWPDCSKCHFVRPHLEKWCKENEIASTNFIDDIYTKIGLLCPKIGC